MQKHSKQIEQSEQKTEHELGSQSPKVQCQYFELYSKGNEKHWKQVFEQERDMFSELCEKKDQYDSNCEMIFVLLLHNK